MCDVKAYAVGGRRATRCWGHVVLQPVPVAGLGVTANGRSGLRGLWRHPEDVGVVTVWSMLLENGVFKRGRRHVTPPPINIPPLPAPPTTVPDHADRCRCVRGTHSRNDNCVIFTVRLTFVGDPVSKFGPEPRCSGRFLTFSLSHSSEIM